MILYTDNESRLFSVLLTNCTLFLSVNIWCYIPNVSVVTYRILVISSFLDLLYPRIIYSEKAAFVR